MFLAIFGPGIRDPKLIIFLVEPRGRSVGQYGRLKVPRGSEASSQRDLTPLIGFLVAGH